MYWPAVGIHLVLKGTLIIMINYHNYSGFLMGKVSQIGGHFMKYLCLNCLLPILSK